MALYAVRTRPVVTTSLLGYVEADGVGSDAGGAGGPARTVAMSGPGAAAATRRRRRRWPSVGRAAASPSCRSTSRGDERDETGRRESIVANVRLFAITRSAKTI